MSDRRIDRTSSFGKRRMRHSSLTAPGLSSSTLRMFKLNTPSINWALRT